VELEIDRRPNAEWCIFCSIRHRAADNYALASSLRAKSTFLVGTITGEAGVLQGRTQSNDNGNNHMSVSAAPISILSASHSHRIIYFFICVVCLALISLDILR
jgi:hypothetical protein